MKKLITSGFAALVMFAFPMAAQAHFGMIIPSKSTVTRAGDTAVRLELKFWHPFENKGMDMEKPAAFQVFFDGKSTNLLPLLKEDKEQGKRVWNAEYMVKRPGLYAFAVEPAPYFEKEEDCYIIHYTKVYVDAFGLDEGWDKPLGLKAEIVPLVKPGGLYAGNIFQGQVLRGGKPEPHAEVEVEWYPGPALHGVAPHAGMVAQTVKADGEGIFCYAAPVAGWWGFAALKTADTTLPLTEGGKTVQKPVEEGAVIWTYFHPMRSPAPMGK